MDFEKASRGPRLPLQKLYLAEYNEIARLHVYFRKGSNQTQSDGFRKRSPQDIATPAAAKNTIPIEAKEPVDPSNRPDGFSVVGIVASAGGLGALRAFFEALPAETGMAFVVITHLHPEYESHMAELLQKSTRMPVMQVTEKTRVEVNHVYVIPPNRSILMTDTHLDTREFEQPHGRRTPIDHFFRSMAAITISDQGRGFDATAIFDDSQGSGGLMNIRHRLQLMGCDIEVESQPGRGTRTIIHVPQSQVHR